MAGKTLSYFNLTGGLNTVQTMATINSTPNRTESPDMFNVEYFKLSGIKTMNGNVLLNKGSENTQLNTNESVNDITFGYEYVKGNERYMIVSDLQNLYEYNPVTDTFTKLLPEPNLNRTFPFNGKITMCGYANGVVACCDNKANRYLVYYQKDRNVNSETGTRNSLGNVTANADSNIITIADASAVINSLGTGDLIDINDRRYEISSINTEASPISIELTTNIDSSYTGTAIYLTDFSKIYLTSRYTNQYSTVKITNFTASIIASHQGRLWIAAQPEGKDTTCVLIYSDLGAIHNAFDGGDDTAYAGGYFEEFWEDTSDIIAIGTWDKYVVVHKREHTYLIDTSNSDATTWNVQSYSEYTCDNQSGFVKANNGYYTYCSSAGGIYPMIQRTIYSAISQGADASTKIRDSFLNLSTNRLDKIYAVYHPYKKYIMFYMPMIGDKGSQTCYILDLQTRSWLVRKVPQVVSTAFQFNNKVYIGTEDGRIYEEFRGTTFNGEPIQFSWKSPWFIWGGATNWTTTREVRVKMSQEGTNNFYIRNRRDGNDSYKQRGITNTTGQVVSLMWDEGFLLDEVNRNYTNEYPLYSYQGLIDDVGNTKTYYSFDSIATRISRMYDTQPSTTVLGGLPAAACWYKGDGTVDNYDGAIFGSATVYCYTYTPTQTRYKCYRSTKDPNIKAWVDISNTSKAVVNVKDEITITRYAFYGVNYNYQRNGNILAVDSKSAADEIVKGTTKNFKMYYKDGNTFTRRYQLGNRNLYLFCGNGALYAPNADHSGYGVAGCLNDTFNSTEFKGTALAGACLSWSRKQYQSFQLERATEYDVKGSTGKEIWNGKTTRSGKSKTVSYYSESYITIGGVRYNRYSAGDEGTIADNNSKVNVWSSKAVLVAGDTVYRNYDLITPYGTVDSASNNNYNINGRIFVQNTASNRPADNSEFWIYKRVFPTLIDEDDTLEGEPTGITLTGNHPLPEEYTDNVKLLTDTTWDNNRWVNSGQVTKRFPIDRQYFQTLQIEFCGETDTQGIELYGFEIDGIQLTEVPW